MDERGDDIVSTAGFNPYHHVVISLFSPRKAVDLLSISGNLIILLILKNKAGHLSASSRKTGAIT
jgi:hypothetical protein